MSTQPINEQSDSNTDSFNKSLTNNITPKTVENRGYNWSQISISSFLLIGPLLMGIAINSVGNSDTIREYFAVYDKLTNKTSNVTANDFPTAIWSIGFLFPFGGWVGSIFGALTVDRYGRKTPSIIFCFITMLGSSLKIMSKYIHVSVLLIGRFFDGIGTAGLMVSAVLLLFDNIPENMEPIFKPLVQIGVNAGLVMIGGLSLYSFAGVNWNLVYVAAIFLAFILLIAIYLSPESPKYIYSSTKSLELTSIALKKLRGRFYCSTELNVIQKSVDKYSEIRRLSVLEFLGHKQMRLATTSFIILHMGQQLCGINAIAAFAPFLLKAQGIDNPDIGGLIICCIGLLGSALFAHIVGKKPRKTLWIIGFVCMAGSFIMYLIGSSFNWIPIINIFFLCFFMFMFQLGPGPVVWFISVEMYPPNATGAAQGVGSSFNWLANAIVYLSFPILTEKLKEYALIVFLAIQVFVIVYSCFFVVETLNRTPHDVLEEYQRISRKSCLLC